MRSTRLIYFIISAFIAGNLVLIFIKYTSDKGIKGLMDDNEKLLSEFTVRNQLESLEKDVVFAESKIRDMVASGDTSYIQGQTVLMAQVRSILEAMQKGTDDDTTKKYINELYILVQESFQFDDQIVATYFNKGKAAADSLVDIQRRKRLTDSILLVNEKITDSRQDKLVAISRHIDDSVRKMQRLNTFLVIFVICGAAVIFWHIVNTIRKQNRLIHQVSESEKKVKEIARVKENFLANMSHEIRTPMNAILGFTQLLTQKKLDDETRHYVTTIQRSGENLLAIVNDILDISKIEAGMMRIEKAPFTLRGLVNSVGTVMQSRANAKGIEFSIEIDNSIPDVLEGDPVRLTQILSNLLSNALKFTSKGSISLKITPAEVTDSNVQVKMDFADTGIGIEPEQLKHVFGRFQQADETITRQYGGTGLGLSIVKDLVELQGGTISIESEPGKGTVFHVVIPYAISSQQVPDNFAIADLLSPYTFSSQIRVLVVEDNEFNQSLLSHIFTNWHIQFDIANNGLKAIEKLSVSKYELVLMDIQMPVMDGYTAALKIRDELRLNIPIIAMTAHALPGEREKCLSYGMNEYIAKPVKQELLSKLITRFTSFIDPELKKVSDSSPVEFNKFQYIRLNYMKEVSAGNEKYEKDVTRKFLDAVPLAIQELKLAANKGDLHKMKQIAHNLKTTVSVMGLNELLDPLLDEIEEGKLQMSGTKNSVDKIVDICDEALKEAREFQASFS